MFTFYIYVNKDLYITKDSFVFTTKECTILVITDWIDMFGTRNLKAVGTVRWIHASTYASSLSHPRPNVWYLYYTHVEDKTRTLILAVCDCSYYTPDTCGGQNRNIHFSAVCLFTGTHLPLETIDHIKSGHSQMEYDSVHSVVNKAKNNVTVYAPMGYFGIILYIVNARRRRNPNRVNGMSICDFSNYKHIVS